MRSATQRTLDLRAAAETAPPAGHAPTSETFDNEQPLASPARALQERLAEDLRLKADEDLRWSPRATLALSGGLSLLLWAAMGLALNWVR